MENERFIQLKLLDKMPEKVYIDAIHDDFEGFRVILGGDKPKDGIIRIRIHNPLFNWSSQESAAILHPIDIIKDWWLFRVDDSKLSQWFSEMSYLNQIGSSCEHYYISSQTQFVDIITDEEINVEWLHEPIL